MDYMKYEARPLTVDPCLFSSSKEKIQKEKTWQRRFFQASEAQAPNSSEPFQLCPSKVTMSSVSPSNSHLREAALKSIRTGAGASQMGNTLSIAGDLYSGKSRRDLVRAPSLVIVALVPSRDLALLSVPAWTQQPLQTYVW